MCVKNMHPCISVRRCVHAERHAYTCTVVPVVVVGGLSILIRKRTPLARERDQPLFTPAQPPSTLHTTLPPLPGPPRAARHRPPPILVQGYLAHKKTPFPPGPP